MKNKKIIKSLNKIVHDDKNRIFDNIVNKKHKKLLPTFKNVTAYSTLVIAIIFLSFFELPEKKDDVPKTVRMSSEYMMEECIPKKDSTTEENVECK